MVKDNKHEFALFYSDLPLKKASDTFLVNDVSLVQRITSVLRLKAGDQLVLFNREAHVQVELKDCLKKNCLVLVKAWNKNKNLFPDITVFLPLLKRDAFESAIYASTALGATKIQLVQTEKTRKWQGQKELERLERIVIAAAEQSKNFDIPLILKPCSLQEALQIHNDVPQKLFADPTGKCFTEVMKNNNKEQNILLFVGPEGDLTTPEKQLLKNNFVFCRLTPTILKSEQALALLLGMVRSLT